MAGNVNKVILIGRVGQDPEDRVGNGPARFSMATSKRWRDKSGEQRDKTTWHQIVTFRENLVTLIENHIKKGSLLYVEGELTSRSYDKDGQRHWVTEILVDFGGSIKFVEGRSGGGRPSDPDSYGARAGDRDDRSYGGDHQYDMSHDEESAYMGREGSRGGYERPLGPPPGYDPNKRPRTTMDDDDFTRKGGDEIPF